MNRLAQRRAYAGFLFICIFLSVAALTRLTLFARVWLEDAAPLNLAPKTFVVGLGYDLLAAAYFSVPYALYLLLMPDRLYRSRWHRPLFRLAHFLVLYLLLFVAAAEWVFWDEFGTRFNFIAVDYLVYTHEVLGNIRESYPLPTILGGLFVAALSVFVGLSGRIDRALAQPSRLRERLPIALAFLAVPALGFVAVDGSGKQVSDNRYVNELAGNGIYDFFAAFRNNRLDYASFYRTEEAQEAQRRVRAMLAERQAHFEGEQGIRREIVADGPQKRLNVVLITVESLSASYLGIFGNADGLTPNLDRLAQQSLLFTRLYAAGTRTVRGLEAITLSLPPTPGQSIVKRPGNEGLFSLGQIFRSKGYDVRFVYGGYGYFDNMNYFFENNGYDIVDRASMSPDEIHFANIWGIADEDLFDKTIKEMDASWARGKPSFNMLMTTSNHRPFTYPEGRIDIPSHTGKSGGVKYTDYAINRFIELARAKPWFDDTIFVIVADHCASSAGKTRLPVDKYLIPLIVYSPKHVPPGKIDRLASQIDVAPTLLGLLNFSYASKFFGLDILRLNEGPGRAFISNYQELGLLKAGKLEILGPRMEAQTMSVDARQNSAPAAPDADLEREAIAWYQTASALFDSGGYRWEN